VKRAQLIIFVVLLTLPLGCANGRWGWWGQDSVRSQRAQAQRFDPYPERETGPDIPEARPMGFERNVAEPFRARWFNLNPFRGSASAPTVAPVSTPVYGPQGQGPTIVSPQ